MGRVSRGVIRGATAAVLVVKGRAREIRRVAIGCDGSANARRAVAFAAATLTRAGWRVKTAVNSGPPLRELLRTVDAADADLLVVGARGTGGIRQLLLGSVAEGALNRSSVPVCVVR